jgi:hypothetical protein
MKSGTKTKSTKKTSPTGKFNNHLQKAPKNTKRKAQEETEEPGLDFFLFTFSHKEEKRNLGRT